MQNTKIFLKSEKLSKQSKGAREPSMRNIDVNITRQVLYKPNPKKDMKREMVPADDFETSSDTADDAEFINPFSKEFIQSR